MHRQRIKVNLRQILSANLYYPDRSFFTVLYRLCTPFVELFSLPARNYAHLGCTRSMLN